MDRAIFLRVLLNLLNLQCTKHMDPSLKVAKTRRTASSANETGRTQHLLRNSEECAPCLQHSYSNSPDCHSNFRIKMSKGPLVLTPCRIVNLSNEDLFRVPEMENETRLSNIQLEPFEQDSNASFKIGKLFELQFLR